MVITWRNRLTLSAIALITGVMVLAGCANRSDTTQRAHTPVHGLYVGGTIGGGS